LPVRLGVLADERLARLVGGGSDRAFAALYERYHQPLYRYCRSMVGNDTDAQDALQSTFAGALVALRRGQRDAPLRPWLFRIAHNESVSLLRRRRPEDELPEGLESSTVSVEDAVEARARLALLMADLRDLPERQRGALVMRELSGLTHEEVALALGISVGAAKQTVFEARRSLMEFSEGRAMACEEIRRVVSDGDKRALRARRVRAHLRGCSGCATFAAAIPARRADLLALSPALPAIAASGLIARITGAGSGHSGGGGLVVGATGKTVGVAMSAKTIAVGVVVVATSAVGAAGVLQHFEHAAQVPRRGGGASAAGSNPALVGPGALGRAGSSAGVGHGARTGTTESRSSTRHHARSAALSSGSVSAATGTRGASAAHAHGASSSDAAVSSSASAGSHSGVTSHPTPGHLTGVAPGRPSGAGSAGASHVGGGSSGSPGPSGTGQAPTTPAGGQTATTPGGGGSGTPRASSSPTSGTGATIISKVATPSTTAVTAPGP
jgi:RNA polymerase sigma factor (sigma-70 family)